MTADLLAMRDWLISEHVSVVGMEATGAYWKPISYLLESDVECWLRGARHIEDRPGAQDRRQRLASGSRNSSSTGWYARVSFPLNLSGSYET